MVAILRTGALACLLGSFLLFVGCQGLLPEPEVFEPNYEPEVGVFGLLGPGEPYNFVVVERTVTIEEYDRTVYNFERIQTVIEDARVVVSSEADTVEFSFSRKGTGAYRFYWPYDRKGMYVDRSRRLETQPGRLYRLEVHLPDGRIVRGRTRVPGNFSILTPTAGERVSLAQIGRRYATWTDDPGTAAYKLAFHVEQYQRMPSGYCYVGERNVLGDYLTVDTRVSLSTLLAGVYIPEGLDSLRARLEVTALDPNYYDYIRSSAGLAEISGLTISTLEGAIGAFGSVNVASVEFVLVR